MSKITKKGIIKKVGVVETVGADTKIQRMILFVPARKDEFGDTMGSDDFFEITAISKKVAELNLNAQLLEKKVEVECYLNGRQFDRTDGTKGYAHNLNLNSIKVLEDKAPATATASNEVPKNF